MKISALTFIISVFILPLCFIYAGDTSIIANYPAPSGTYNKIVLQGLYTYPNCATQVNGTYVNAGMIYMYTDPITNRQTLEICSQDGSTTPVVHYPETCFNRFWNTGSTVPNSCPSGYGPSNVVNSLNTDTSTTLKVTTCCTQPTVDGTATWSTVNTCLSGGGC